MMVDTKLSDSEFLSRSDTDIGLKTGIPAQTKLRGYFSNAVSFLKKHKFYSIVGSSLIAVLTLIIVLVVALYETESSRQAKAKELDELFSNQILYDCFPNNRPYYQEVEDENVTESVGKFIVRTLTHYGYTTYPKIEANVYREFNAFMIKYRKVYYTSDEKSAKYMNFRANYEAIKAHNDNPDTSYKMAWGQFSDMTQEEISKTVLPPMSFSEEEITALGSDLFQHYKVDKRLVAPEQFTWDEKVLGPVLNQSACGSCWAFASAGAIQSLYNINNNERVVLSPQEFVDCVSPNEGCQGGMPVHAFNYAIANGLCRLNDYPYIALKKVCAAASCKRKVAINGALVVTDALDVALSQGSPIVVGINAETTFQHYSSGIFDAPCVSGVYNHAVLLVGYGVEKESGKKFWVIKNSWGPDWGENGYARISRSDDGKGADCNLASLGLMPL